MTWTTPKTWNVGDAATAADMNTYVRDNSSYLYTGRAQFQVHLATAQSIANNAGVNVLYDTVDIDNSSGWSATNYQYTVPAGQDGMWLFYAAAGWASNATGIRGIGIIGPPGSQWDFYGAPSNDVGSQGRSSTTLLARCGVGQVIHVQVWQTSGGALNFGPAVYFSGALLLH